MPHFNADNCKSLHDPITFRLSGRDFTVRDLDDALLEEVDQVRSELEGAGLRSVLTRQLALFTGEAPEAFDAANVREMSGVLDWIMETLGDPRQKEAAKNGLRK